VLNINQTVLNDITRVQMRIIAYAIFKIGDPATMTLVVSKTGKLGSNFGNFEKDISYEDDCAYGYFYNGFLKTLVMWCPNLASIRTKVMYAAGFEDLKSVVGKAVTSLVTSIPELENVRLQIQA